MRAETDVVEIKKIILGSIEASKIVRDEMESLKSRVEKLSWYFKGENGGENWQTRA